MYIVTVLLSISCEVFKQNWLSLRPSRKSYSVVQGSQIIVNNMFVIRMYFSLFQTSHLVIHNILEIKQEIQYTIE